VYKCAIISSLPASQYFVGRRQPSKIIEDFCAGNFTSASQMAKKAAALSNLMCEMPMHTSNFIVVLCKIIGFSS